MNKVDNWLDQKIKGCKDKTNQNEPDKFYLYIEITEDGLGRLYDKIKEKGGGDDTNS